MIGSLFSGVQSVFIFLGFLSILIAVHEWGHFITAKRLGVDVQRFALGFGPTLFSKEYNGTLYMINLIPMGGYVKMAGDEFSECEGKPGEFLSSSIWRKSLIVFNGPLINFVLAYICFVFVFMIGYPGQSTVIPEVTSGGPAQIAGLQAGDKIVAIDSKNVYSLLNLGERLAGSEQKAMEVTVLRQGEKITRTLMPEVKESLDPLKQSRMARDLGIDDFSNVIGGLIEGAPAENSGLQIGDQIVQIDSNTITSWKNIQEAVAGSKGNKITIAYLRDGTKFVQEIIPNIKIKKSKGGQTTEKRTIGIAAQAPSGIVLSRFGLGESFKLAGEELFFITKLTYRALYLLVTGGMAEKESVMGGPIMIFYAVKGAAESGISHFLFMLGYVSASLAIFNLLPIVPLDGGHLFLFSIEKIRGKALSQRVSQYISNFGFSLFILLALFVFYSDFKNFGWFDAIGQWFGYIRKLFP